MPDPGSPGRLTLSEDDRRILAAWAADCAERTLALFEAVAPDDHRPRLAIHGLRAFARGELKIGQVRAASAAAYAAAGDVTDPSAVAAARSAGQAAGTAQMGAHAWGAAAYAAYAVALLAPANHEASAGERTWQLDAASPEVRDALRRLPPAPEGGGRLGMLIRELQEGILAEG